MYKHVAVLGHQPDISIAELERVFGGDEVLPIGDGLSYVKMAVDVAKFGGIPKSGTVIGRYVANPVEELDYRLFEIIKDLLPKKHKISFGISSYISDHSKKQLRTSGIALKKRLHSAGFKARYVPNREKLLSPAQVWHNKLDMENNFELTIFQDGDETVVTRTTSVQDVRGYSRRDREKPERDSKIGMLPPKLAKTMINLSGLQSGTLLDPYCGSGTVLMEAMLMGFDTIGSDISIRMTEMAEKNMKWFKKHFKTGRKC
jgi:hypothetical protein